MLIARLHINVLAFEKLAARGISDDEVRQAAANGPYVPRNPHPRVPGSRLIIGPTDGGRILTIVIQPDDTDTGTWHVMTGWDASSREAAAYRRHA